MVNYALLSQQIREMLDSEPWYTSAMSNISALLMDSIPDLNWVGFYLLRRNRLTVGPFQGHPACIHIDPGRGVCGTALARDEIQAVPDVHRFPGHIACDSASRSEMVLPIHHRGKVMAVLDMDSPVPDRFSPEDQAGLARIAEILDNHLTWEGAGE